MTRREELDMLKEKEQAGEKLSNKEKKLLSKYKEELEEEFAMQEEYSAGLESFALTLGGKSTGEEGEEGETLYTRKKKSFQQLMPWTLGRQLI